MQVTVAVLGIFLSSAFSPKIEPGASTATVINDNTPVFLKIKITETKVEEFLILFTSK